LPEEQIARVFSVDAYLRNVDAIFERVFGEALQNRER